MSSDVSCFDNIIGLSRTPCSDYSVPTIYSTSDSGLYLDELIPMYKVESLLNCKVGENVFVFMDKARDNAIIDFRIDATAILARSANVKRRPFVGRIGKVKRDKTLSLTVGNYYGIVLRCDDIVGGELVITNIGTIFDTTGMLSIVIYNNLNQTIGTYIVNTTAGALEENTESITLPMHSSYVDNLEYYIVYQYAGNSPYNNEFVNHHATTFGAKPSQSNKQYGFSEYLVARGVNLSSVADLSDVGGATDTRCFGLTLALEARCKVEEIWCYDEMDYVGDAIDMAIAKAVRLKAGLNLIRDIALSQNLNRSTMVDGATLGEMEEAWSVEYAEMIEYIVKNVDLTKTDCFECGKEILMGLGKILS